MGNNYRKKVIFSSTIIDILLIDKQNVMKNDNSSLL